jgi:hypothetical protein
VLTEAMFADDDDHVTVRATLASFAVTTADTVAV